MFAWVIILFHPPQAAFSEALHNPPPRVVRSSARSVSTNEEVSSEPGVGEQAPEGQDHQGRTGITDRAPPYSEFLFQVDHPLRSA